MPVSEQRWTLWGPELPPSDTAGSLPVEPNFCNFASAFCMSDATGSGLKQTGFRTQVQFSVAAQPSAVKELEADVKQKELQTLPSQ